MKLFTLLMKKISDISKWFIHSSLRIKIIVIVILVGAGWFTVSKIINRKSQQPQYQTAQVEKGTLIVSISVSGQVTSANSAQVTTQASGVVKKVDVENGQTVQTGTPIAEIELDLEGNRRSSQAYASYQSAQNSLESAKANYYSMQSSLFTNWKTFMDTAQSSTYQNADGSPKTDQRNLPQYMSTNDDWLASEAKFKIQQNVISQAQTSVNNAWLSYQQTSPTIYAPITGTVTGLSLQPGTVITSQTGSSGNAVSQKIASIQTNAEPTVTVNLTEIDAPNVKIGNKATLTLDAFPGKTFTGKVVSIDTVGSVTSGVTTYPTIIKFDTDVPGILSNMSAQASIITNIKDNVLLVPSAGVQNQNGESTARVLKNGQINQVTVTAGLSSDSQIEITSGLSEGDTVVTSVITTTTSQQRNSSSPFGAFGGGRGGFGGR